MSDSFPADRHLDNLFNYCIKLNCIKWKALELLLEVWLIIFNKYMNAASIRIAFIGLF